MQWRSHVPQQRPYAARLINLKNLCLNPTLSKSDSVTLMSRWTWFVVAAVQSLCCVWLFATPWTAACQASLFFTISWSFLKFISIESMMPSNHLILCHPLLLLPSIFPSIRVFSNESVFQLGGQSIGASASILPVNIQGWFPSGLTSSISLLSKGLSRVFSCTTVRKHQFFGSLNGPTLTAIHYYWKNCSFYYMYLCQKSDVSACEYTV